jgi:hypothetical protein
MLVFRWCSRSKLSERKRPVHLQRAGKRVLLQVVEAWYAEVTMKGLPAGVWELRNELLADDEL